MLHLPVSPDDTLYFYRYLCTHVPLTVDRLEALLQMQRTDPYCKYISKHLLNGKAPQHEIDIFTHIKGLLYKHVMENNNWGSTNCCANGI